MHPFLQDLLIGFGRVGVRAGAKAVESVMEDATETVQQIEERLKRARERLKRMHDPEQ